MKRFVMGLVAAATVAGALPALASAQPVNARANVAVREHTQQQRIAEGVRAGRLTPRETARLERREVRVHRIEARMHERDGARLTHHDRRVLARTLNRDSRAIHRMTANARVG